ncbi:MAG: hypothetical protein QME42_06685 [bacterium]|nr:hypothetical protein [bacterium]
MKINYAMLSKSPLPVTGIGGSVPSYIIEDSTLIFGIQPEEVVISIPLYVIKHPLEKMEHLQKNQILRMPSLLGRDIIEKFKLTFDVQNDILTIS